jgi:hypothetical protein
MTTKATKDTPKATNPIVDPQAAVLPPHVAAGELITSSWGNNVVNELQQHEDALILKTGFYAFNAAEGPIQISPAETIVCSYTLTAADAPGDYLISFIGQTWTTQNFNLRIYAGATIVGEWLCAQNSEWDTLGGQCAVTNISAGTVISVRMQCATLSGGLRAGCNMHGHLMRRA